MFTVLWTQPSGAIGELEFPDLVTAQDFLRCLTVAANPIILKSQE